MISRHMLRAEPFLSLADIDHRLIIFLSFFFFFCFFSPLSLSHRFPFSFLSFIYISRTETSTGWKRLPRYYRVEWKQNPCSFFFPSTISRTTVQRRLLQLGLIKIDALEMKGERKRGQVTVDPTPPDRVHSRFISVNGFNANFIRVTGVVSICNSNRPPTLLVMTTICA